MKLTKIGILVLTIGSFACSNNKVGQTQTTVAQSKTSDSVVGNYVSSDYQKRKEGYDWVSVAVTKNTDSTVHVSIRSRADLKKPTCTFDAEAKRLNDTVYTAKALDKNILFTFNLNQVTISTEHKEDTGVLNYYCSGGGSLAGIFDKLKEPIDTVQIDKTKVK
jgi:hypothetical protein